MRDQAQWVEGAGPGGDAARGGTGQVLTPTYPACPPGIDKLTEKSQVSEDGTLRSLEPAPPQSPADGSPAEEVGEGL